MQTSFHVRCSSFFTRKFDYYYISIIYYCNEIGDFVDVESAHY